VAATGDDGLSFSLVGRDALERLERASGLAPRAGLGVGRRILFFAALTWVPIVAARAVALSQLSESPPEPLLRHFGVHARCLIATPIFIAAEAVAASILPRIVGYFVTSGLVQDEAPFRAAVRDAERLRDSWIASAVLVGLTALAAIRAAETALDSDALSWAVTAAAPLPRALTFAGRWYLYVSLPVFIYLGLRWLWRLAVWTLFLRRIARLDLRLVPTHPDGAGGLGFLEQAPVVFAPVVFALSAVMASRWGHEVLYHGAHVAEMRLPVGAFVVVVLLLFLGPLLVFSGPLLRLKRRSLFEYGALVGRHGYLVERRWIRGEPVDDQGLLSAPELGPVADTITLYESITRIRPTAFRRGPAIALAAAALVPMIPVFLIEIPVKDLLAKIAGALL
jgi:hypothetical protein